MIFTEKKITISNNQCKIDSPVVLYRGDYNVEVRFTIVSSPYKYSNKQETNVIEQTEASYGQLVIKTPGNKPAIFSEITATKRGAITFTITAEMIDEVDEIGDYTFQIRLLDENKESRATIPEVKDGIEIREPIATEDVSTTNQVGIATVGYALTTTGTTVDAFDSQGNYNKTTWAAGDRITDTKLNKTEDGIDGVNRKVENIKEDLSSQIKDKADQSDLLVERERIDSLTRLQEDSTTRDAEVIDGRVGANGITYANIGSAIREQTSNININQLSKGLLGSKYKIKSSSGYPGITFDLLKPLNIKDVKNIKIKFKLKNYGDLTTAKFQLMLWKLGLNKDIKFNSSIIEAKDGEIHEYVLEADTSYTEDAIMERCILRVNINTAKNYEFDIYDFTLYINKEQYVHLSLSNADQCTTDFSDNISYLATKESVEVLDKNTLKIGNINDILNAYESATKSNIDNIACWGDSITAGGGEGQPYPTHLQNLLGDKVTVTNNGISGNCSGTVAFRQGGNKFTTNSEITIPPSNSESIDIQMNITSGNGKNCRNAYPIKVNIGGVNGTLTWKDTYTSDTVTCSFVREDNGESVTIPINTSVISLEDTHGEDINIIWVGRNDIAFSNPYHIEGVIDNVKAMVEHLTPQVKKFLIVSVTTKANSSEYKGTANYNSILEINTRLKEIYPYNFIDIREYLVNKCIYDIGLTPTSADLECIANDTLPPQIMASSGSDVVHPGPGAKEQIGKFIYKELLKRNWIKQ